jgi:multidrug efflux pump subunit AcrA (membrane-fusion protein)
MKILRALRIGLPAAVTAGALLAAPAAGMRLASHGEVALGAPSPSASPSPSPAPAAALDATDDALVAVLLPPQMADLSSRTDARVIDVRARVGQAVKEGDVIVAFDQRSRAHDLAIAQAELRVLRADANVAGSEVAVATTRAGRRSGTIDVGGRSYGLVSAEEEVQSRAEVDTARARATAASARIAEQSARVEQLRLAMQQSDLRAPFSGIVSWLTFQPGMTAHADEVVARVVGGKGLRVRIAVPEAATPLLSMHHARLAWSGHEAGAVVAQVTAEPEPASRMFLVDADVVGAERLCEGDCYAMAGRSVKARLLP